MRTLVIVLGDQLDHRGVPFDEFDNDQDAVLMMEVEEESRHVASHRQRTTLFLAAMRHFAMELREKGRRLQYVCLDDADNTQSFDSEVRRHVTRLQPRRVVIAQPGEWRVMSMVERWAEDFDADVEMVEDRHFLTTPEEFQAWAEGRSSLVMEYFYREQRRRLDVLMEPDGTPVGDAWNFDAENREAFQSAPVTRRPYRARPDDVTREVMDLVGRRLGDLPGRMESFHWPVTRDEAKRALRDFVEHRLPDFGTHQDAMWTGETSLFHSRLSAAMNLKLLRPMECVDAAVAAWRDGCVPLNAVEGFVRQIIGWREFIRGVYWQEGPEYADGNALEHHGALPSMYWSGDTDMVCMRESLGQVLDESYGHHIQRLMVTGNFALLAGLEPRAVSDWYLGMYVDGVDWVTLPNTLGMALHADGGVVGTKPYAASGKYIQRMSNYCDGCRYDVKRRSGEGACPFNVLYWDFLIRHRERLGGNRRMAMMFRNLDRFGDEERVSITVSAGKIRDSISIG